MPKSKPRVMLRPAAWDDLKRLQGNARRSIIKAIDSLEQHPRPAESKQLSLDEGQYEVRRLRLGNWRVIYLLFDDQLLILAIRRRPPYDYADLASLIEEAE